jgi:hypothetical protein
MLILNGKRPLDKEQDHNMIRGYNGPYCYYDDLSFMEKWKIEKYSILSLFNKLIFKNDLKHENEQLKSLLKKANSLLQEATQHLDRDFNWVLADQYEKKVKNFMTEYADELNDVKKVD